MASDAAYLPPSSSLMDSISNTNQEIAARYLQQYLVLNPLDRANKLREIYNRNPEALVNFLNLIKGQNNYFISNGLFSLVYELIISE